MNPDNQESLQPQGDFIPKQFKLGEVPSDDIEPARPSVKTPEQTPKQKPRGLETYASDMAEAMREQEGSVIKIALAEERKREREAEAVSPSSPQNRPYVLGGMLLGLLALIIVVFIVIKSATPNVTVTAVPKIESVIYSDMNKEIDITGFSKEKIAKVIADEVKIAAIPADNIENISLVNSSAGEKREYGIVSFLEALQSSITPALLRALDPNFMLGIYHTPAASIDSSKHIFMLLPVISRDDAMAGMLAWEKKMLDDFFLVFSVDVTGERAALFQKPFSDGIVKNIDVRILKDDAGKIVLLYGFPTDNMIVITDSADTFSETVNRLHARKVETDQTTR